MAEDEEDEMVLNLLGGEETPAPRQGASSKKRWAEQHHKRRKQPQRSQAPEGGEPWEDLEQETSMALKPSSSKPGQSSGPPGGRRAMNLGGSRRAEAASSPGSAPDGRAPVRQVADAGPLSSTGGDGASAGKRGKRKERVAAGHSVSQGAGVNSSKRQRAAPSSGGTRTPGDEDTTAGEGVSLSRGSHAGHEGENTAPKGRQQAHEPATRGSAPGDSSGAEPVTRGTSRVPPGGGAASAPAPGEKPHPSAPKPLSEGQARKVFAADRFAELGLAPALADHIEGQLGFKAPTHIQKAAIPAILTGKDVLVNAQTGTGKTLVYLAPIIHGLQGLQPRISRTDGTFALILAPTRELCLQIHEVAQRLVQRFVWLVPGHVMGGANKNKEKARLRKGVTILVATPGRLLDHLQNTKSLCMQTLRWLVFDEADRLLDLGFEKDILEVLRILDAASAGGEVAGKGTKGRPPLLPSSHRQTVLLSATLNTRVDQLAAVSLREPVSVGLEEEEEEGPPGAGSKEEAPGGGGREGDPAGVGADHMDAYRIPSQLSQSYMTVPSRLRLVALASFLRGQAAAAKDCKLVVFFSTCDGVEFHHAVLSRFSLPSRQQHKGNDPGGSGCSSTFVPCELFKLHGNLTQKERAEAFFAFGRAASGALLCTDVAARGLDFPSVTGIVQYDPAGEPSDYVHRVGRTGRLGQRGEAVLFLQPAEREYLTELAKHGVTLQEGSLSGALEHIPLGQPTRRGKWDAKGVPEMHEGGLALQARLETFVAAQAGLRALATDAFRSYLRAYAAHRGSLKRIFHPKKLHLGHVAKSFALKDAPSRLGASSTKKALKKRKDERALQMTRKKQRLLPAVIQE